MSIGTSRYGFLALSCILTSNLSVLRAQSQPGDFIGITPCRVVDTRGATGTFGGPTITGGTTRVFPIPAGPCTIPSTAIAYSFNIAVVPPGPLGYITVWPDGQSQPLAATLNDATGLILSNAAIIQAGSSGAIDVFASNTTDLVIDIDGYFLPQTDNTDSTALGTGGTLTGNTGTYNSAFGFNSLVSPSGSYNTASGASVLSNTTTGAGNTALGYASLYNDTTGSNNTAVGYYGLESNIDGTQNVAVGYNALPMSTSDTYNTAVGGYSLYSNNGGGYNTALGDGALSSSTTGANNIAIGFDAGFNVVTGSYNISIGEASNMLADESNTIRIGDPSTQTAAYIAGIYGTTVTGSAVLINSNGQLGVASSSARYKDEIRDMGESSDALLHLRPVTFRYKQAAEDGTKPLQYGLIGEEVEKVYPELVVHGRDGQVESVQYHQLPALLLNELQKQHKIIEELQARIAALETLMHDRVESGSAAAQ